jgi:hypothetical protein
MALKLEELRQGVADMMAAQAASKTQRQKVKQQKASHKFLFLVGFDALATYVVERRAVSALPLLQAIHRRLLMSGKEDQALTLALWKEAGDPPQRARTTILAHLRRMPDLIAIREAKSFAYRYHVAKGPLWRTFETAKPTGDEESDIANDEDVA